MLNKYDNIFGSFISNDNYVQMVTAILNFAESAIITPTSLSTFLKGLKIDFPVDKLDELVPSFLNLLAKFFAGLPEAVFNNLPNQQLKLVGNLRSVEFQDKVVALIRLNKGVAKEKPQPLSLLRRPRREPSNREIIPVGTR